SSDLDRGRDLYRWAARESERRYLRSQMVDSKPESGDQLRHGRPLAAYRPLRPIPYAYAYTDASAYTNAGAYPDASTDADRVAQDSRILRPMGHLRPQLQGAGPGHHRDGEQVDAHPLRLRQHQRTGTSLHGQPARPGRRLGRLSAQGPRS